MKKKILMCAALIGAVLAALLCGSVFYSPKELLYGLLGKDGYGAQRAVLVYVRLPHLLGGIIAGAGLSLSGVLLQTVTSNPLAGPNIIGVNAGAGLGTVLMLAFLPGAFGLLPLAAFAGAMTALLFVLLVSKTAGGGKHTVILAGVALTSFFQAGISLVSAFDTDVYAIYSGFALGSLGNIKIAELYIPAGIVAATFVLAYCMSFRLEALTFGDDRAASLGISPGLLRGCALTAAALSAAAVVSFAGLLGFVGLIVPHMAEKLAGTDLRKKIISAPVIGAAAVLLADTAGRTLFYPSEIAVGIITAVLGAPAFMVLLFLKRRERYD